MKQNKVKYNFYIIYTFLFFFISSCVSTETIIKKELSVSIVENSCQQFNFIEGIIGETTEAWCDCIMSNISNTLIHLYSIEDLREINKDPLLKTLIIIKIIKKRHKKILNCMKKVYKLQSKEVSKILNRIDLLKGNDSNLSKQLEDLLDKI